MPLSSPRRSCTPPALAPLMPFVPFEPDVTFGLIGVDGLLLVVPASLANPVVSCRRVIGRLSPAGLPALVCTRDNSADALSGNGGISSNTVLSTSSVGIVASTRYSQALCCSSESRTSLNARKTSITCCLISGKRLTNLMKALSMIDLVSVEQPPILFYKAKNCSIGLDPGSSAIKCPNSPRRYPPILINDSWHCSILTYRRICLAA